MILYICILLGVSSEIDSSRFFFFFQAEDGIRDLVRSRGLGDVYKRQGQGRRARAERRARGHHSVERGSGRFPHQRPEPRAVSYTHLTLPTIYSV